MCVCGEGLAACSQTPVPAPSCVAVTPEIKRKKEKKKSVFSRLCQHCCKGGNTALWLEGQAEAKHAVCCPTPPERAGASRHLARRCPLPLHSTYPRAITKRYSPVTRDFKDNGMEDCITFNTKIIRIIKKPKRKPLMAGLGAGCCAKARREGPTQPLQALRAIRGKEQVQELRKHNLHSNVRFCDFFRTAWKPSVVRGHAKPWLLSTKPVQPPHYAAQAEST